MIKALSADNKGEKKPSYKFKGVIIEKDFNVPDLVKLSEKLSRAKALQNGRLIITDLSNVFVDNHIKRLVRCSEKLIGISELESNWNENGAEKFSLKLIIRCYSILVELDFLPEIFPVADGSIQFEYEKSDGSYLEFDIFEDKIYEYRTYPNGDDIEMTIEINKIPEEVKNFYEQSSE